jgi:thiol-disulfide isomerase/thioredoxin
LNKLKKYSGVLWILAIVLLFFIANGVYRKYATQQIIDKSFGNNAEVKLPDTSGNNDIKLEKNEKGMPLIPNFTLKNSKGDEVSLSDYSGKIVILNFWASWCPPCKAEMPEFKEMDEELKKSKEVVLLTINLTDGKRETKDTALKFLKDNNYNFNVLFDDKSDIAELFGIQSIPTTIIIDKAGYLHDYIMGTTTKKAVLDSIKEVK